MAIVGPAEVHPEEHLGPVGRLGPTGSGADRQDRGLGVVFAREEQGRSFPTEVALQGVAVAIPLRGEVRVTGLFDELAEGLELLGPPEQAGPQLDVGSERIRLAKDLLRFAPVFPERGLAGARFELRQAPLSCGEVKDAPRSTGSARPGRGRQRRPSVSDLEILEQDRTELDESESRLAPGDDGVHAGAVAVVGTHAAIAIAVEGRRVAAASAIALAGDQIDEGRFLSLLHDSLSPHGGGHTGLGRGDVLGATRGARSGIARSIGGLFLYAKREKRSRRHITGCP
jgi:hypothetical protein